MKKVLCVCCLFCIINYLYAQVPELTFIKDTTITPAAEHKTGVFCRIYNDPFSYRFFVSYAGLRDTSSGSTPNDQDYVWIELDTLLSPTGASGILPGFSSAGDYAMIKVGISYYHLSSCSGNSYCLKKFDLNFQLTDSVIIPLPLDEYSNDQLLNFTNNKLIFASNKSDTLSGNLNCHPHIFVYDTSLNYVSDVLLSEYIMSWGGSIIYNNNRYCIVSSDNNTGNPNNQRPLKVWKYTQTWQLVDSILLDTSGQWSQGLIYENGYYFISYHTPGIHIAGNIKVAVFDTSWNKVTSLDVTAYALPADPMNENWMNAQRPFLLKTGNTLYVAYDVDTMLAGFIENKFWQAHIAILNISYNITGFPNDEPYSDDLVVFPNPADEAFNINIKNYSEKIRTVTINDLKGKEILISKNIHQNKCKINCSALIPGCYILNIKSDTHVYFKKIIIE